MKSVTIGGRLTRDAKLSEAGGTAVVGFSVAVDDRQKVNGQWEKKALFFECSLWGQRGPALASYLTQGKAVCVSGDLSVREFTRVNGSPGHSLTIRAEQVTLMGGRDDGQPSPQSGGRYGGQSQPQGTGAPTSKPPPPPLGDFNDDDIPF